ncbi:hypothetical protein BT63DRAFT_454858 [Microthyrium microscopicum]|uniref:Uncharacterized protein n=1 Tax=Microthyrium microscopicum TaxID=703497 RepID=A0A6A6UGI4_9PEZI|nr:hypothetical protein BT63DRAFT_454858 [Microthyrium microscopicum]
MITITFASNVKVIFLDEDIFLSVSSSESSDEASFTTTQTSDSEYVDRDIVQASLQLFQQFLAKTNMAGLHIEQSYPNRFIKSDEVTLKGSDGQSKTYSKEMDKEYYMDPAGIPAVDDEVDVLKKSVVGIANPTLKANMEPLLKYTTKEWEMKYAARMDCPELRERCARMSRNLLDGFERTLNEKKAKQTIVSKSWEELRQISKGNKRALQAQSSTSSSQKRHRSNTGNNQSRALWDKRLLEEANALTEKIIEDLELTDHYLAKLHCAAEWVTKGVNHLCGTITHFALFEFEVMPAWDELPSLKTSRRVLVDAETIDSSSDELDLGTLISRQGEWRLQE